MWGFLRFNSRHHFYWQIRGPKGLRPPRLNPIESSYGPHVRNISLHEPIWLWRIRQRLFAFAGRHRCPDRGSISSVFARQHPNNPTPDTWDTGPDGNRTCSYCGSIHFDDLMKICRRTMVDECYSVDRTDKRYKAYVRQPGVRNASEGAIKFYIAHAPADPTDEQQKLYADACNISWLRFEARMRKRYPRAKAG